MSLLTLFKKKELKEKPYVYVQQEHTGWGDRISWSDWDTGRVNGHLHRIPRVGDKLRQLCESGKIAEFEFIKIERCDDPTDIFFATVKPLSYVDDIKTEKELNGLPGNNNLAMFLD